jgi:hypothetical protein
MVLENAQNVNADFLNLICFFFCKDYKLLLSFSLYYEVMQILIR